MHRRTACCMAWGLIAAVAISTFGFAQEKPGNFTLEQATAVAALVRQQLAPGGIAAALPQSLKAKAPGRLLVTAFKAGVRLGTVTTDLPTLADSAVDAAKQLAKPLSAQGDPAVVAGAGLLCVEVMTGRRDVSLTSRKSIGAILDIGNEGLAVTAGGVTRYFSPLAVLCNAGSPAFLESLYKEVSETPPDLKAAGVRTEAFSTRSYAEKMVEDKPSGEMLPFIMGNVPPGPVTTDSVRRAILGGGAWIMGMREADGKFVERYDPQGGKPLPGTDAVMQLDAARTLYYLYVAVIDKDVLAAADKLVEIIRTQHVRDADVGQPVSFVKYGMRDEVGPSVALLQALCDREAATSTKAQDRVLMGRLAGLILYMTGDNGALQIWLKNKAANLPPPESTEGTAEEAILALCSLCELTPKPENEVWRAGAEKILRHEIDSLGTDGIPDPRLVEALARLYNITQDVKYADQCLELAQRLEGRIYRMGPNVSLTLVGGLMGEGGPHTAETAMAVKALVIACDVARARKKMDMIEPQPIVDAVRFVMAQQYRPENSFFFTGRDSLQGSFRAGARDVFVGMDTTHYAVDALLSANDFVAGYNAR